MNIGIVGSGNIGGTLARLWARSGHQVALSNSRGPASLRALVDEIGPNTRAATVSEAADFGEVVLLAIPWRTPEGLPSPERVAGKIVIDAMNPYSASHEVLDLGSSTASEETARRLPGARLVKAFNTIYYRTLAGEGRMETPLSERLAIYVASDDEDAKALVSGLIVEIGFAPIDTGSLREGGRMQQPGSAIYGTSLTAREARAVLDGLR